MDEGQQKLSALTEVFIKALARSEDKAEARKITVNPLVSTVASWYERLRNVMDYREEEVILRAAIERILKRRIILGGDGKSIAPPLVRELVWARYFQDNSLPEILIGKTAGKIDIFLKLRSLIQSKRVLPEPVVNEWFYHLLSSDIEYLLNPKHEKELVNNFMFQIIKDQVQITDDSEQTRDAQVYIAVRRAFAKDDIAFLRYHLFLQIFGELTHANVEDAASQFRKAYGEMQRQLYHPRKERIFAYVKNITAVFFILEDLVRYHKGSIRDLFINTEALASAVMSACDARYSGIASKVNRAIVRSVIFILLTKAFLAFTVEGTIESIVYGRVLWESIILNVSVPPVLMIIVGMFIRIPGKDNSRRILAYMQMVLSEDNPRIGNPLTIRRNPEKTHPFLNAVFSGLWFLAFIFSFGMVVFILTRLHFNILSQGIFIFFLTIVSFLSYRIGLMSKVYAVEVRQGLLTPVIDFFFMPIIQVGRQLTEGISQINILLFVFDFIIETPFKGISGFLEQWFFFLHSKREDLG